MFYIFKNNEVIHSTIESHLYNVIKEKVTEQKRIADIKPIKFHYFSMLGLQDLPIDVNNLLPINYLPTLLYLVHYCALPSNL